MKTNQSKSTLHLQLGQETIYLIMSIAVVAAVYLAIRVLSLESESQFDAPIITLDETDGYSFSTGSSNISQAFKDQLIEKVVPKIEASGKSSNATIVEVVGHTDEVPINSIKRYKANLDYTLVPILNGSKSRPAIAADNVGLGMARAVAVASILRESKLKNRYIIIPMSAGPFLKPDDSAGLGSDYRNDAARRRIEIRLRRKVERTKAE